jgi:hypothetical protein
MSLHRVWHLMTKLDQSEVEAMLLKSILILSITTFNSKSLEQIYDLLASLEQTMPDNPNASMKDQLKRIEATVMATSTGVQRLQADEAAMRKTLADLQAQLATFLTALSDAEGRLEADIAALRSQGGAGDPAAIAAIADSLESTQAAFSAVTSQLTQAAQTQLAVDPAAAPAPTPTSVTLTISPTSVTTVRDATVQFSANVAGVTFRAANGSIDATGLYTPPVDPSVMSDTVVVALADGSQNASASVSIS